MSGRAWLTRSRWDRLCDARPPALLQQEHGVVIPQLPHMTYGSDARSAHLSDAVDSVVAAVRESAVDSAVLVAHSWAGYPVPAAAHELGQGTVRKVVYYNAVVLAPGVPTADRLWDRVARSAYARISGHRSGLHLGQGQHCSGPPWWRVCGLATRLDR
ncbi:alpha/beta fold hydrolase [Streptomyces scabichelini]|uniref:alpha/beta fold hydrolase n=1 Tax=Streptomyces scabichelini TaxID=2711217 RepID=UPI003B96D7BF